MLPLCEAEGVGVIPWSPLARGLLSGTRKSLDDRESTTRAETDTLSPGLYNQPGDWDVVEALKQVAEARKTPPAQVALAWLLSKPVVTAPIIGATKLEHLEDAVKAVGVKLQPEELKALEAPYKPHAVRGM